MILLYLRWEQVLWPLIDKLQTFHGNMLTLLIVTNLSLLLLWVIYDHMVLPTKLQMTLWAKPHLHLVWLILSGKVYFSANYKGTFTTFYHNLFFSFISFRMWSKQLIKFPVIFSDFSFSQSPTILTTNYAFKIGTMFLQFFS